MAIKTGTRRYESWSDSDWEAANSVNIRFICSNEFLDFDELKQKYPNFNDLKAHVRSIVNR